MHRLVRAAAAMCFVVTTVSTDDFDSLPALVTALDRQLKLPGTDEGACTVMTVYGSSRNSTGKLCCAC